MASTFSGVLEFVLTITFAFPREPLPKECEPCSSLSCNLLFYWSSVDVVVKNGLGVVFYNLKIKSQFLVDLCYWDVSFTRV